MKTNFFKSFSDEDLSQAEIELLAEKKRRSQERNLSPKSFLTHSDGASRGNPGHAGAGALLFDNQGLVIDEACRYLGKKTNNEAEYEALILALEIAGKKTSGPLSCYMDSELLVRQLRREYALKSENLIPLFDKIQCLLPHFTSVTFHHVPRGEERQAKADRLANKAIDMEMKKTGGLGSAFDGGGLFKEKKYGG